MMKRILLLSCLTMSLSAAIAQTDGVLIDYTGATRDNSAVLEANSTQQGMLVPRMTLAQRDLIATPAHSLLIYQTDNTPGYYYNSGTSGSPVWQRLFAGSGSPVTGNGVAGQVTYWSGANTIVGSSNFTYSGVGNLSVFNPESAGGEVRLGAAWGRPGLYSSQRLELQSGNTGILFGNANTEHMRLTAAGNLAIGNTAGSHQLHVGVATADGQAVTVRGYSNTPGSWKGGAAFGYTAASVIMGELSGVAQIGGHNSALGAWANLAINSGGGNVVIGAGTPLARFHVAGGGQILGTNGTSSNTRTLTILEDGDAQVNFGTYPGAWTSALQIQDNTTNRYVWLSPLDNGSGSNARLLTYNTGLDFYTGANVYSASILANGVINANIGYRVGGAAPAGQYLRGNGTDFVASAIQVGDIPTGSGNYIQNQFGGAQSAEFWVSGRGHVQGEFYYNGWLRHMGASQSGLYWQEGTGQFWHMYPANQQDMIFRTGSGNGGIMGTVGDATARGYVHWTTSNEIGFLNSARTWSLRVDDAGNSFHTASSRAPIFYDLDNTGYFIDPNGTSELYKFSRNTLSRNSINSLQEYSPWATRAANSPEAGYTHRNGAMGWGNTDLNTIYSNWGGGIFDSWGSPANSPGGITHAVGFQAMHSNYQNGSQGHGWQMVSGEHANRFYWRNAWPNLNPWVEMIHTGNIGGNSILNQWGGNQSANFHISGSGRAGADLRAPIFYDENNTGYYLDPNGVSNLAGITTSVNYNTFHTWTNLPGHHGLYSSVHNSAHFYPNNGSYGSWRMDGTRNGWGGIEFPSGAGNISLMIGQGGWGGMTTGMHANSYGWLWYFSHQSLYAASLVDINDGNYYIDPNSSTRITGNNWLGDASGVVRIGHNWAWNYCVGGWYCCSWDWWGGCNGNCWNACQTTQAHLKLSVHGAAESLGWWGWSDGRFKENVSTVSNAVSLVKKMRGVTYDWKELPESYDDAIKAMNKVQYDPASASDATDREGFRSQIGVIAQELKEVLPMAVMEVEDKDSTGAVIGTHFSVNYDNVIPVLIEAIKEQQQQIEELKMLMGMTKESGGSRTGNEAMFKAMRERAAGMNNEVKRIVEEMIVKVQGGFVLTPEMRRAINDFITNGTIPEQP